MNTLSTSDYLHRNGIILERARRSGQSLTSVERSIVLCGRDMAKAKGATKEQINAMEMVGERDWDHVLKPVKVKVVFAYYDAGFEEIPPSANYLIRESNHPALPEKSHVCAEQLINAGVGLPWTPTYETWQKRGKRVVRK